MSDVTVHRSLKGEWIIYAIEEGLDRVEQLPGFKNPVFRIEKKDASAGVDDPRTTRAVLRRLGGVTWNDALSWEVVDEAGHLIAEIEPRNWIRSTERFPHDRDDGSKTEHNATVIGKRVAEPDNPWAELKQNTDPPVCTECGLHIGGENYGKLPALVSEDGKHVLGYRHRDCPPKKKK